MQSVGELVTILSSVTCQITDFLISSKLTFVVVTTVERLSLSCHYSILQLGKGGKSMF